MSSGDLPHFEITGAVPPHPPAAPPVPAPTLAHVWSKLGALEVQLARLVTALLGDLDGKGGALGRIKDLENQGDDHAERLATLEGAREKAQEKGLDRAWAIAVDVAKMIGAGLLGALAAKGGPHA